MPPSRFLTWVLVGLALGSPRRAAADSDWPRLLFKTTRHDFGTVARGAVTQYRFQMENPYLEDVYIEKVWASCGCTTPTFTRRLLKTHETGEIVATLDTRRFLGQKDTAIYVKLAYLKAGQSFSATFPLRVTSYIRSDIVFEPGEVEFGSVPQGETAKKQVSVSYAGRPDWQILKASTDSAILGLQIAETGRSTDSATGVGKVMYDLGITLKPNAPTGYFKDIVVLTTNDLNQQTARVPITVEGLVLPSLSVNPAVLMLNVVPAGESRSRNITLTARKPFRIVGADGPDSRFHFAIPGPAKPYKTASSTLYAATMTVEFQAGDIPGKVSGKIRIKTDLAGASPLEVSVGGQVAARAADSAEGPPARSAGKDKGPADR